MICIPIVGPTMAQALKDFEACQSLADIIELRLDLIADHDLPLLLKEAGKPCIVTNRCKIEGGQFKGSEDERIQVLRQAIDQGAAYIDIETSTPGPLLKSVLENKGNTQAILSHHDFTRTSDKLEPLYELMCQLPGDVLKIVTYAQDLNDNLTMFKLLARARKEEKKLIGLCMGEKGEISRILTLMMGGFLTFGALATGKESAPGQIMAATLKHVYRVNELTAATKIFGVIGDPVSKSLGYLIHNRALRETGLPHVYVPFWVQNVTKFFNAFEPYISGLSVTMPFKEDIQKVLDEIDPVAQRMGAVNTVVRQNNRWVGHNTDGPGALQALTAHGDLRGKQVLILGAGGTAKAIGQEVVERGGQLTITYNRNREKAQALANELQCQLISIRAVDQQEVEVLINCSPVGMTPNINETPFPARLLKPNMVVFDAVYNPTETRLLKEAAEAGCKTISGLEFFINQAAAQFELWTGKPAPVPAMRQVLMDHLNRTP